MLQFATGPAGHGFRQPQTEYPAKLQQRIYARFAAQPAANAAN